MENVNDKLTPSSREMSSLLKVRPGIRLRFLSQKMEQNEPEKKMPSTAAKATRRSAKVQLSDLIHLSAHCALLCTAGMVSTALNNFIFSAKSLM
jgi:hypothetical protein